MSVPDPEDYGNFEQEWTEGALAWETGTAPTALIHGLDASLSLLTGNGNRAHCRASLRIDRLPLRGPAEVAITRSSARGGRAKSRRSSACATRASGRRMALYAISKSKASSPRRAVIACGSHRIFTISTDEIEALISALPERSERAHRAESADVADYRYIRTRGLYERKYSLRPIRWF